MNTAEIPAPRPNDHDTVKTRKRGKPNGKDTRDFLAERLELSDIPADAARYAGIKAMTAEEAKKRGYRLPAYCVNGFLIRYYDEQDRLRPDMWRWRNDPACLKGFRRLSDRPLKGMKYGQPADTGCEVYWPRCHGIDWEKMLADTQIPIVITEGELKALCLCVRGVAAVALGGVWNWTRHKRLLPALERLAAHGRELWIAFDSDTDDKPEVATARFKLAKALTDADAVVRILTVPKLPANAAKAGIDDWCRLRPKLRGKDLSEALLTLEDHHAFLLASELYRLNAEYVINEESGRIHRLTNLDLSWDDLKFVRLIENTKIAVPNGKKETPISASREWIQWPLRNRVVGRCFQPMAQNVVGFRYVYNERGRLLNNWQGWASVPLASKRGEALVAKYWTALLDHHFCQKDEENEEQTVERQVCRRWFEQWWAYAVQNPGVKMLSCTVLEGEQGGGKGLVGYMVQAAVYGQHFREVTQKDLEGNFNDSFMGDVSLLMGSEITTKTTRTDMSGWFKNFITSVKLQIRRKHVPEYFITNLINAYFTTNYEDAFFLDDDDRRYFIWAIPPVRLQDSKKFGSTWIQGVLAAMKDPDFCAALHWHLLNLDMTGFDHTKVPDSPAKRMSKTFSHNAADEFIEAYLDRHGEWEVFRFEDAYEQFKRDNRQFGRNGFLRSWRKRLMYLGRIRLNITDLETNITDKNVKTGLWTFKPDFTGKRPPRFMTLEGAKARYLEVQKFQAAEPSTDNGTKKPEY